jgi:hypothetical protein
MTIRHYIYLLALAITAPLVFSACKDSSTSVDISKPQLTIGQTISSDTLKGTVKGTMISGHTYYFSADVTVNAGDTLLMQSGVNLLAVWDSSAANPAAPQLTINGSFVSLGTKDQPNYISVLLAKRTYGNIFAGLWGGVQGSPTSGDIVLKWTHIEYAGAIAGAAATPPYKSGKNRYLILFQNPNANFILEDSWIRGGTDDAIRTLGGHISAMRNTFEFSGLIGGECLNMKGPTVGDVAYNLMIGSATNGPKLANTSAGAVPTTVNIYNNTILNGGWRRVEAGRSGSTDIEAGARGTEYNNLIVNCKTGFREVPDADSNNVFYDYMYYYGQSDSIVRQFYPADGIQKKKPHDIAGAAKANDPKFVNYDVNQFDYTLSNHQWPMGLSAEVNAINEVGNSNFRLASGSPAIGKGYTGFSPMKSVPVAGDLGATITLPGKDIGAYQTDGTGNQH